MTDRYWNYLTGKFGIPWRHETVPEGWSKVPAAGAVPLTLGGHVGLSWDCPACNDPVPSLAERLRNPPNASWHELMQQAADALEAQAGEIDRLKGMLDE